MFGLGLIGSPSCPTGPARMSSTTGTIVMTGRRLKRHMIVMTNIFQVLGETPCFGPFRPSYPDVTTQWQAQGITSPGPPGRSDHSSKYCLDPPNAPGYPPVTPGRDPPVPRNSWISPDILGRPGLAARRRTAFTVYAGIGSNNYQKLERELLACSDTRRYAGGSCRSCQSCHPVKTPIKPIRAAKSKRRPVGRRLHP